MPNHVSHKIIFSPECTNLTTALEAVRSMGNDEHEETNYFDLNKIIPEPEELSLICYPHDQVSLVYYLTDRGTKKLSYVDLWRYNTLDEKADYTQTMDTLHEVMAQYDEYGRIKESVNPKYTHVFALPETLDKLYQSGKAVVSLRTKHKFKGWHDCHRTLWGTKWNTYSSYLDDSGLFFATAWNTPRPAIVEFARKFNLTMTVMAFDEGHNFWLINEFVNGVLTEERHSLEEDKANLFYEIYGYSYEEDEN